MDLNRYGLFTTWYIVEARRVHWPVLIFFFIQCPLFASSSPSLPIFTSKEYYMVFICHSQSSFGGPPVQGTQAVTRYTLATNKDEKKHTKMLYSILCIIIIVVVMHRRPGMIPAASFFCLLNKILSNPCAYAMASPTSQPTNIMCSVRDVHVYGWSCLYQTNICVIDMQCCSWNTSFKWISNIIMLVAVCH